MTVEHTQTQWDVPKKTGSTGDIYTHSHAVVFITKKEILWQIYTHKYYYKYEERLMAVIHRHTLRYSY